MSETIIPKTKKECFALLNEMLSDEDKQAIVEMEDVFELHFTLGLWIRNNWLYPQSKEEREALLKDFGQDTMFCHPDDDSTVILETYRKYLKRKKVKKSPSLCQCYAPGITSRGACRRRRGLPICSG